MLDEGTERCPAISTEQQAVFKTSHCARNAQHYRVLNLHSVRDAVHLICTVCNDAEQMQQIMLQLGIRGARATAPKQLALAKTVARCGVDHKLRAFVHEIWPFCGIKELFHVSADMLIFEGSKPSAKQAAMRAGLTIFWDGQQHMRWEMKRKDEAQVANDMRISKLAAEHGYNVLRISYLDAPIEMQVIDAAWRARRQAGTVMVSPRWNTGAHPVHRWLACCARH